MPNAIETRVVPPEEMPAATHRPDAPEVGPLHTVVYTDAMGNSHPALVARRHADGRLDLLLGTSRPTVAEKLPSVPHAPGERGGWAGQPPDPASAPIVAGRPAPRGAAILFVEDLGRGPTRRLRPCPALVIGAEAGSGDELELLLLDEPGELPEGVIPGGGWPNTHHRRRVRHGASAGHFLWPSEADRLPADGPRPLGSAARMNRESPYEVTIRKVGGGGPDELGGLLQKAYPPSPSGVGRQIARLSAADVHALLDHLRHLTADVHGEAEPPALEPKARRLAAMGR